MESSHLSSRGPQPAIKAGAIRTPSVRLRPGLAPRNGTNPWAILSLSRIKTDPYTRKGKIVKKFPRKDKEDDLPKISSSHGGIGFMETRSIPVKPSLEEEATGKLFCVEGQSTSIQGKGTRGTKQGSAPDSARQCSFVMKTTTK